MRFTYTTDKRPSITAFDTETLDGFVGLLCSSIMKYEQGNHKKPTLQAEPINLIGEIANGTSHVEAVAYLNKIEHTIRLVGYLWDNTSKEGLGVFFNLRFDWQAIFKPWFYAHVYSTCNKCKTKTCGSGICSKCGARGKLQGDYEWKVYRNGRWHCKYCDTENLYTIIRKKRDCSKCGKPFAYKDESIEDRGCIFLDLDPSGQSGFRIFYKGDKGFTIRKWTTDEWGLKKFGNRPKSFYDISPFFSDEEGTHSLDSVCQDFLGSRKLPDVDRERLGSDFQYWKDNMPFIVEYCKRDSLLTQKLGDLFMDYMSQALEVVTGKKGIYLKVLSSKASVSKALIELLYPQLKDSLMNYTVKQNLALARALKGGLPLARILGRIHHASGNDVVSTYPSQTVLLPDVRKLELRVGDRYDPDAVMGTYYVKRKFHGQEQYYDKQDGMFYPVSTKPLHDYLTKLEVDYLMNEAGDKIQFEKCWQFYGDGTPLFTHVGTLVELKVKHGILAKDETLPDTEQKKNEILSWMFKIIANSIWGSLSENRKSLGKWTNFIYGAYCCASARVKLWRMNHLVTDENLILNATDSCFYHDINFCPVSCHPDKSKALNYKDTNLFASKEMKRANPISCFGKWESKFRDTDVVVYKSGIYAILVKDSSYCECRNKMKYADEFHRKRSETTDFHTKCEMAEDFCECGTDCNSEAGCQCKIPEWYPDSPPKGMEKWVPCYCLHELKHRGQKTLTAKELSKMTGTISERYWSKPFTVWEAFCNGDMTLIDDWNRKTIDFNLLSGSVQKDEVPDITKLTFEYLWRHPLRVFPTEKSTEQDEINLTKLEERLNIKGWNKSKTIKVKELGKWHKDTLQAEPEKYFQFLKAKLEPSDEPLPKKRLKHYVTCYRKLLKEYPEKNFPSLEEILKPLQLVEQAPEILQVAQPLFHDSSKAPTA